MPAKILARLIGEQILAPALLNTPVRHVCDATGRAHLPVRREVPCREQAFQLKRIPLRNKKIIPARQRNRVLMRRKYRENGSLAELAFPFSAIVGQEQMKLAPGERARIPVVDLPPGATHSLSRKQRDLTKS